MSARIWPFLSYRQDKIGGPILPVPQAEDLESVRQALDKGHARGLVLLIHGYNNSLEEANTAYAGFHDRQRELMPDLDTRELADNRDFVRVYWPSDADWGILSVAFYMGAVTVSKDLAPNIADTLRDLARGRPAPLYLEIIAHSLGCRLALEILRCLGSGSNIEIRHIVTMAAAVPIFKLERTTPPQALRQASDAWVGQANEWLSLYSRDDRVLAYAFPPGQTLASGDEGDFPVALGHDCWADRDGPHGLKQDRAQGADHSDYWGWKADALSVSRAVNQKVHDFLGFAMGAPRTVDAAAPTVRDTMEARATAPGRETRRYFPAGEG